MTGECVRCISRALANGSNEVRCSSAQFVEFSDSVFGNLHETRARTDQRWGSPITQIKHHAPYSIASNLRKN